MKPGCVHTCVALATGHVPVYALCVRRCGDGCVGIALAHREPGADNIIIKRQYRADIGLMERPLYRQPAAIEPS